MISSSILNSITFKNISGNYPNMWNRLHSDRKQSTFKTIPYCQKFQKDHVVYLQFTSEQPADVTLKAYSGIVEIESFTSSYITHYGTVDNRYFFNFVVTLDSIYYNKSITFKITQGTDILTSEPIYTQDLTQYIANGQIKYIKYTNLDRNDSDLDDRFIDWEALTSTGKYMDFFIEAQDITPNDSDSVEILEGSQSQTILSANYYSGRVLKTAGIPDYLVTRLGMASSLDIFIVNDLQYIKTGEIEQENLGQSTLYQCSINLTQKNTIGINVDNLGIVETPIIIPVEEIKMYIGYVESAAPSESEVKLMTELTAEEVDQLKFYDITYGKRFCFAYPASFGILSSAMSNYGSELLSVFVKTTALFTFGTSQELMNIYTYKAALTYVPVPAIVFSINYKF